MKKFLLSTCVAVFAIFVGSQITEGALLVPYWKSISAQDFYAYYKMVGPSIARFFTILTVVAALIPVGLAIYARKIGAQMAFKYAIGSVLGAVLFIAAFYVYFKGVNASFLRQDFTAEALEIELVTWGHWHWSRVGLEVVSLFLLMKSVGCVDRDPG